MISEYQTKMPSCYDYFDICDGNLHLEKLNIKEKECYHASQGLRNVFEHKCQHLFINLFSNSNNKSLHDIHFY